MVKAILFDLDGTLLDIDLPVFLSDYFAALGPVLAEVTGLPLADAVQAVLSATAAMQMPHPGFTNRAAFESAFASATRVDLGEPALAVRVDDFYVSDFPLLKSGHGPRQGGVRAVETSRALGLRVALATNPIFPLAAIRERMRWADVADVPFDVVTSYESASSTKPHADYFREVAAALGVAPHECVMVGDDAVLDMSAADVGMRTFYVGPDAAVTADWSGTLDDFAGLVSRIVE